MRKEAGYVIEPRSPAVSAALHEAYDLASIEQWERPYRRSPDAPPSRWALDVRIPLARSSTLRPIAAEVLEVLRGYGIRQVAGRGVGAFALLGALTALGEDVRAGYIRDSRKTYGFQRLIEGNLRTEDPVFLVDDVLSSGRSSAINYHRLQLEGFSVRGVTVVFQFWRRRSAPHLEPFDLAIEPIGLLRPTNGQVVAQS